MKPILKKGYILFKGSMNLDKLLKDKRVKECRKAFRVAFKTYRINRSKAFKDVDKDELKRRVREIREASISQLEFIKKVGIKRLKENGVNVYEANDKDDVIKIFKKLVPKGETVVKSKSNVINEVELVERLKDRNKFIETDCGDFIVQVCEDVSSHPVTPALHLTKERIVEAFRKKFGVKVKPDPIKITRWIRDYLKKKILKVKVGLTGANLISADGSIIILENEGNISLVTRIPEKHIVITSIDKFVPRLEDAMVVCKALGIWGTGTSMPVYINVISGPSKTADVEKKLVVGMHGAREVHLILVDNGRKRIIESGLEEMLYCINCGSCLYFCPVYRQLLMHYGYKYFGGIGVARALFNENVKTAFEHGLYFCTTCSACKFECPVGIDVAEIIRKLRAIAVNSGFETDVNRRMIENVEAVGNPFGEEIKEGKVPKELYCC